MAKDNLTIHTLMKPSPNKAKDRSVWSLPLNGLWIPFFTATNATGESHINSGALGCPMRLAVDKAGVPKLKDDGSARYTVDKEISNAVKMVKDNFAFGLMSFTETVKKTHAEQYKAQVEAAQTEGAKVLEHDDETLGKYLAELEKVANNATATPAGTPIPDREMVPA